MKRSLRSQYLFAIITFLFSVTSLHATANEPTTDLRVVVDISGSMKHNDPNNLRAPALRLLIGLLPDDSKAGIWTFGQYVNMQVKHGDVDEHWKKVAIEESNKIHNRGLFTNIEEALRRSSFGWTKADESYSRHLVLLTDGMVDVSKDESEDIASRQRILQEILPQLKQAGVKVHTIALSEMADHNLLKNLSLASNGWYEKVLNTTQLHKTFLRVFEKSAPMETVPIYDNSFEIDENISDMTVLLFHRDSSSIVELISPDGNKWSAEKHPEDINWHREDSYSMITMKQPNRGTWKLNADFDPDNRIIVATNVKLRTNKVPSSLLASDSLDIRAYLMSENKILNDRKLLDLSRFQLDQHIGDEITQTVPMLDDGNTPDTEPKDGIYSATITPTGDGDIFNLSIQALSDTFRRETRQSIKIYPELADISSSIDGKNQYKVNLIFVPELVYMDSISAQLISDDGNPVDLAKGSDIEWILSVPGKDSAQELKILATGLKATGKEFTIEKKITLPPITADQETTPEIKIEPAVPEMATPIEEMPVPIPEAVEATEPEQTITAEGMPDTTEKDPVLEQEPTPQPEQAATEGAKDEKPEMEEAVQEPTAETEAATEEEGISWFVVFLIVLAVNVSIAGAGIYGYLFWQKKKTKIDVNLDEDVAPKAPETAQDSDAAETAAAASQEAEIDLGAEESAAADDIVQEPDDSNDVDDELAELSSLDEFAPDSSTDDSDQATSEPEQLLPDSTDEESADKDATDSTDQSEPDDIATEQVMDSEDIETVHEEIPETESSEALTTTPDMDLDIASADITQPEDLPVDTGGVEEWDEITPDEITEETDTTSPDVTDDDAAIDDLVSELDAEINNISQTDEAEVSPPEAGANAGMDEELDNLLNEEQSRNDISPKSEQESTEDEEEVDIDTLKESNSLIEDVDDLDVDESKKG